MKQFIIHLIAICVTGFSFSQVKFGTKEYPNGLRYPVVSSQNEPEIAEAVNNIILSKIGDLETSDFCVGDFGYVQKGSHLQILFMCNCIDMSQTEHRYAFINLSSGEEVPFSDIFNDKDRTKALSIIQKAVAGRAITNEKCAEAYKSISDTPDWSDLNIRLSKDGVEIRPANTFDCEPAPVKVPYTALTEYFKYQFL